MVPSAVIALPASKSFLRVWHHLLNRRQNRLKRFGSDCLSTTFHGGPKPVFSRTGEVPRQWKSCCHLHLSKNVDGTRTAVALIFTGADNQVIFVRMNNRKLCVIKNVSLRDVLKVLQDILVLNRQVDLDNQTTPLIPI